MNKIKNQIFPWRLFLSEMIGTGLLLLFGLSLVILLFGSESPIAELIPNVTLRRVISGFLFGTVGALISLSAVGKESGAHINPAVTMVFWLFRKIDSRTAIVYVMGQLTGAIIGTLPLLLWGQRGSSIAFGATVPGEGYTTQIVLLGEVITTFMLVILLIVFIGFRQIRAYTPAVPPILYAIMVPIEAAISGTSTNPARSLGPAIISGQWDGWWIYWMGPLIGAFLASLAGSFLAKKITVAKLYHFDNDHDGLLRRSGPSELSVVLSGSTTSETK